MLLLMEKSMKLRIVVYGALLAIVAFVLDGMGVLGFTFPRAIENDPLRKPLLVTSVTSNSFTLADGRSFLVIYDQHNFFKAITNVGVRVDLDEMGEEEFTVYTAERGWICGTPWARMITIPLIPQSVPINHRRYAGMVQLKAKK
jgi:hypothetical protein